MNSDGVYYNDCEEYRTVIFLERAVGISTFHRWGFWLGWWPGNFLFWDNFLRNFRHLKDISRFILKLMKSNGLKLFPRMEEIRLQSEVRADMYL